MTATTKSTLRRELLHRRDEYSIKVEAKRAAKAILDNIIKAKIVSPEDIIGSYWPVKSEVDVRPLLTFFYKQGHICALPVVQSLKKPLQFRIWCPGDLLVSGAYNILTPDVTASLIMPTVLMIPVLGFDRAGYRLGHGEGYYDRTLELFRAQHSVIAIGIAYDCQEVDSIPHQAYDERMDFIITPTQIIEIKE